jgi:DNA-binding transcriptional MerR regulator
VAAGLAEHDLVSRYEKDVFVDALDNGEERTHVENYVRFARRLEALQDADNVIKAFPELIDCLPEEGDVDNSGQALCELFQRQQRTVNDVLEGKIQEFKREIRQAILPKTCLLSFLGSGEYTRDPRDRYASRLRELLCKSLPSAFQTNKAVNERHVQDVGETAFIAAQESLHREAPQLPFAAVTTKPDFSDLPQGAVPLFIEFKYVKERNRLNKIQTEMTSRVTVYKAQGACILFMVYDPRRSISNDDAFIRDFENHQGVWVGVVR